MEAEKEQHLFGELVNMILTKKQNLESKYPNKIFKTIGSIMNFEDKDEVVLKNEIKTTDGHGWKPRAVVDEVLNNEIETTEMHLTPRQWKVDDVLNCVVKTTPLPDWGHPKHMEEALNHNVETTSAQIVIKEGRVEEVLNHNVETTKHLAFDLYTQVEEVLNHEVNTTSVRYLRRFRRVEEVLNCDVETTCFEVLSLNATVEEVLNHEVETIGEAYQNDDYVTEEILNNTIDTYGPGNLVDEEKHINNVLNYGTSEIEIKTVEKLRGENPFQDVIVGHILDESDKVTDKLKIAEDNNMTYGHDVFMCEHLVQNVLEIGSNSISFDVTSQQGRVNGVLKNS